MDWKVEDLTELGDTSGMTEVFAQQDIPQFGIQKGDQGFRRRPSLVFAVVKGMKGPYGGLLAKALDYDPATSNEWWDVSALHAQHTCIYGNDNSGSGRILAWGWHADLTCHLCKVLTRKEECATCEQDVDVKKAREIFPFVGGLKVGNLKE